MGKNKRIDVILHHPFFVIFHPLFAEIEFYNAEHPERIYTLKFGCRICCVL